MFNIIAEFILDMILTVLSDTSAGKKRARMHFYVVFGCVFSVLVLVELLWGVLNNMGKTSVGIPSYFMLLSLGISLFFATLSYFIIKKKSESRKI